MIVLVLVLDSPRFEDEDENENDDETKQIHALSRLVPSAGSLYSHLSRFALMDLSRYNNAHFQRGAPMWKEALWHLARLVFFAPPFPWPSSLRCALLRAFGAKIGRGVVIRSGVNVTFPWRLQVSDHVWLGEEVLILSLAPVTLEANVCISQRAFICTGSHDHRAGDFALITKPILIRSGTWIAAQAFIGPGVTLGQGVVVSAGSVVLRDVPDNQIVRGNPAEVVE